MTKGWLARLGGAALFFFAALALRSGFAFTSPGHEFDMESIGKWMHRAAVAGVTTTYVPRADQIPVPNHGPVEIALFGLAGRAYAALVDPRFARGNPMMTVFIKAVPVVFDSLIAALLFLIVVRRSLAAAVVAATVYAVQPVGIYNSAVWGQTDSVYTGFVVAAVYAASADWWGTTAFLFALACASKGNALGFLPFFAVLSLYNWRRLPRMVAGGIAAVALTVLPFALAGTADSLRVLFDPRVPAPDNAPNLWFLLKGPVFHRATNFGWDTPLPLRGLSYAIWIALALEPMRRLCRRGNFEALSLAAAVCAYAFFLFAIGVRERYGFPAAALVLPIALISWEGAVLYVAISAALMASMLGSFLWDPSGWLESYIPSPSRLAMANLVLFAWLAWFAIRASSWPQTARSMLDRHSSRRT